MNLLYSAKKSYFKKVYERVKNCARGAALMTGTELMEVPGSTDIGNLSYACPTLYGNVGLAGGKANVHEEAFLEYADCVHR